MLSSIARLSLVSVLLVPALAGCPELDFTIPPENIECASDAECPGEFVCVTALGRCAAPEVLEDTDAPTATLASDPAVLGRGVTTTLTLVITDTRTLPQAPVLSVARAGDAAITPALQTTASNESGDVVTSTFTYTFTVDADETASELTPSVSAIDAAGNRAQITFAPIPVDLEGPDVDVNDIDITFDGDEDLGRTHATSGSRLTLSATVDEVGARITAARVVQGGAVRATFTQTGDTFATLTLPTLNEAIDLIVEVDAEDTFGNSTTTRSLPVPVDLTAPTIAVDDVRLDGQVASAVASLTGASVAVTLGQAGDAIAFCARLQGGAGCAATAFVAVNQTVAVTLPTVPGTATIEVLVRDRALLGASVTRAVVVVPAVLPTATVTLAPPATQTDVKPGDSVSVSGTAIAGAVLTGALVDDTSGAVVVAAAPLTVSAQGAASQTIVVPNTVTDGQRLRLRVEGTFSGITLPVAQSANTLRADLTPPTVVLTAANGLLQASSDVQVDWTITNAAAVTVNGDVVTAGAVDIAAATSGRVAITVTAGDGNRLVRFTVTDNAGRSAQATLTFTIDTSRPVVALAAANTDVVGVAGVRPTARLSLTGTVSLGATVQSGRLAFFDGAGAALLACDQAVTFQLTAGQDTQTISTAAPVAVSACPAAATVRAELIALGPTGIQSIAQASRSDALFYDEDVPSDDDVSIIVDRSAPPAREARAGFTPSSSVSVRIDATDDNDGGLPLSVTVNGDITAPITQALTRVTATTHTLTLAVTLSSGNGQKTVNVAIRDAVGNQVASNASVTFDGTAPAAPSASALRYVEASTDGSGNDATSTFSVDGQDGAVENNARAVLFGAGATAATDVPVVVRDANSAGAFAALDVTALGTPVVALQVVAIDDAGNRSTPLTITRPRFTLTADVDVVGPLPGEVTATAVDAAALFGTPVATVDGVAQPMSVTPNAGAFDVIVDADLADGLVEGDDSARLRVAGRAPDMNAGSVSFDTVRLDVDFTAPTFDFSNQPNNEALLRFNNATDTATGSAGAVTDRAGAVVRSITGQLVSVQGGGSGAVLADGGFSLAVGRDLDNETLSFSVTDRAGNTATRVVAPPTIQNITVLPATANVGQTVTVRYEVLDDTAVAGSGVTIGGRDAVFDAVASQLTSSPAVIVYTHVVANDGAGGAQDVALFVNNTRLHFSRRLNEDDVTFTLPPADGDGDGVCSGAFAVTNVCALGPDDDDADACVPSVNANVCDEDDDGLTRAQEIAAGTSVTDPDSDNDGFCDGGLAVASVCVADDASPLDACVPSVAADACDEDDDGLTRAQELAAGTIVTDPDSDNDGVCDGGLAVATVCTAGPDVAPLDPCLPDDQTEACLSGPTGCGTIPPDVADGFVYRPRTIDVQGEPRTFGVRFPDNYDEDRQYPITFAFHGDLTCDAFDELENVCVTSRDLSQVNDGAEFRGLLDLESTLDIDGNVTAPGLSVGSIIVYVDGKNRNQFNPEFLSWDTFSDLADNDDIRAVLAIQAALRPELCVDTAHTFAVGFSGGGFFAHTLGCRTGLIEGVATFAGGFEDGGTASQDPLNVVDLQSCVQQTPPAALLMYAERDTTVTPDPYLDDAVAYYGGAHNCDEVAGQLTLEDPSQRITEPECIDLVGCDRPVTFCEPICAEDNPAFDAGLPEDPTTNPRCLVDDQHNPWKPEGPPAIRTFFNLLLP